MTRYFKAVPRDKKFYAVRCDADGEPIRAQVEQATHVVDIIRFDCGGDGSNNDNGSRPEF